MSHMLCIDTMPMPNLTYMGAQAYPLPMKFGPGIRHQYLVTYIIGGTGYFNGHRLYAGQGFIVRPEMPEHYYPDPDDPWEYVFVSSRDSAMENILEFYNEDPETHIFTFDSVDEIRAMVPEIDKNHHCYVRNFKILEYYLRMLNSHADFLRYKMGASNPGEVYFIKARNYIQDYIHAQISVYEIAQMLNISYPYLYKVFMKYANMSPKQYICDAKIEEAKNLLLRNRSLSISEVASSVGFEDQFAFSRFFSLHEKMSPSEYRKRNLKK